MPKYIAKIEVMVLKILKEFPKTRDSDIYLTLKIWAYYYPSRIIRKEGEEPMIKLQDIMGLPREDEIKRVRARIQNHPTNPRYLPTSLEVAKQRRIKEDVWKKWSVQNQ